MNDDIILEIHLNLKKVDPTIQGLQDPVLGPIKPTRYLIQGKTIANTLVEMPAYRLADDEARTVSGPLSDLYAQALVNAQADTLAGVEYDTFCYIFGNIGNAAMVETLADAPVEVIA